MHPTTALLTAALLFATAAQAQDFAGTYVLPTSRGQITVNLTAAPEGRFRGTLVGDDGLTFQLEARVKGERLIGHLSIENSRRAVVEASLQGDELYLTLVPLAADQQPNRAAAQQIVFQKQAPAQPPTGAAALDGTFRGDIAGTPSTAVLSQQGSNLSGEIDAGGYRYLLQGTVAGNRATGTMSDPQTGGSAQFEAALRGEELSFTIRDPSAQQIELVFRRGGQGPSSAGGPAASPDEFERDPALVGVWSSQDVMTSGDASLAVENVLLVNADGTFSYGSGRAAAGGANPWGSWGIEGGPGGGEVRGKWRTANRHIYVLLEQVGQWVLMARYYIEGNKMLLYFSDGSRELWYRQR
ncbi:hypothetical protein HRbin33_01416 [bacterium HR33]|nr:hypothetical protein HRbin33_01416 [bacterium HR33]